MPVLPAGVLRGPIHRFISELTPALARLSPDIRDRDVAVEAFNLAASFADSDGRHTDEEVTEIAVAFTPWLDHLVGVTPTDVRRNGLLAGKRAWKDAPSEMFDILVAADRRDGRRSSWRYYELAMVVAHAVCSLDAFPAQEELADLEGFRRVLLDSMRAAGVTAPAATTPIAPATPADAAPGGAPEAAAGRPADEAATPLPPPEPVEAVLAELDGLIGLEGVKEEVRLVTNLLRIQKLREGRGLPVVEGSRHLIFTGNPGTGKTIVGRLLARIYRSLGVVERGHLVETDRSGLVAGYVGQTAIRVKEVVTSALGGVLLIDEAYALARGRESDFGREAIDTLVKLIEDHRDDLVVIAAGYPDEMQVFVESNPGLRSRFPKTIHFPDYSNDELLQIFELMCERGHYRMTPAARRKVLAWFDAQPRDKGFGNGRLARNLFEAALGRQATRLVRLRTHSDRDLLTLRPADIPSPTA